MGRPVGGGLKDDVMDLCVKYAFGPQKCTVKQTAEKCGISEDSVRRVLKAYTLVGEGGVDALIEQVASRDMSIGHVIWAYNYYGMELPKDFDARLTAKQRGDSFTGDAEQKPATDGDNLLVLCGRINAIGQALSDCLTEATAAKLTDKLCEKLTELHDDANANADTLLQEMKKQTELLQRIEYNTKKNKNQNQR